MVMKRLVNVTQMGHANATRASLLVVVNAQIVAVEWVVNGTYLFIALAVGVVAEIMVTIYLVVALVKDVNVFMERVIDVMLGVLVYHLQGLRDESKFVWTGFQYHPLHKKKIKKKRIQLSKICDKARVRDAKIPNETE